MTKIILLLFMITFFTSCRDSGWLGGDSDSNPGHGCNQLIPAPELQRMIIDIEQWDGVDGSTAGGFIFNSASRDPVLYPFAGLVDDIKMIPNIEFRADPNAKVFVPVDGVVTAIFEKDSPIRGLSVHIKTHIDSCYNIEIDHVRELTVEVGSNVVVGQVIGIPGGFTTNQGQIELQVNDDLNGEYLCPLELMHGEIKTIWEEKLLQLMDDWESLMEDSNIFDQEDHAIAGCLEFSIDYDDLP